MKKIKPVKVIMLLLVLCMAFTMLPLTGLAAATDITADFTDANFLNAVRTEIGKINGEPIYDSDVNTITTLYVNSKGIASLDGIQHFTALETLYCYNNRLTTLDLRELSQLKYLDCNNNQLTTLNLSGLDNLQYLSCRDNSLISLDAGGLSQLLQLDCYNNRLTTFNLSGLDQLQYLDCGYNEFTTLDLSGLSQLKVFNCMKNRLTTFSLSGLNNLQALYCSENSLTSLDLSELSQLETLSCGYNQITTLNLSGLNSLSYLDCTNNCLTSLTGLPASLSVLNCGQNRLTSLDVTGLNPYAIQCNYNWMTDTTDVTGFNGNWDTGNYIFSPQHTDHFKAVTNIIGVPKEMPVNATIALSATAIPDDAEHKNITWTITGDDGTDAVLNGNLLTASNPGAVWIQATITDGNAPGSDYVRTFSVKIKPSHTITASAGQGGSISPTGDTVVIDGRDQIFTVTAKPKYEIADVLVDGVSVGAVDSYTFRNITAAHTIEASFKIINPFIDVTSTDWFYDDVLASYVQDLMIGTAPDKFSPNHNMTRAMAVTVLYRFSGESAATGNIFSDVPAGSWYEEAVAWGAANNIVLGVGNQKFDPMANVTREQLATFLYRYAQYKGDHVTSVDTKFNTFSDNTKAAAYALPALKWACENELLQGYGTSTLSPQSFITRAENAALFQRFMTLY